MVVEINAIPQVNLVMEKINSDLKYKEIQQKLLDIKITDLRESLKSKLEQVVIEDK